MLAAAGCDLLFLPDVDTIYPPGYDLRRPGRRAGARRRLRPGHFRGVATVVLGLFTWCGRISRSSAKRTRSSSPWYATWCVICTCRWRSSADRTCARPTVSRCRRATPTFGGRAPARGPAVARAGRGEAALRGGERQSEALCEAVRQELAVDPEIVLHYVAVVDPDSFAQLSEVEDLALVVLAAKLGTTRLIDNIRLES